MAGHSKFKNIMHRKGAQDRKRAKVFDRLSKEITIAAKSGMPDPDSNPRLRTAIQAAKSANMPNDRIKRAINSGSNDEEGNYDEIRYEGFGPAGVAMIVEALTDNRNRTASEVRTAFNKHGGTLGETNSVSFMFDHVGLIHYPFAIGDEDSVFEAAVDVGADNVESDTEDGHDIYTTADDLGTVRDALEAKFGTPEKAALVWKPQNLVSLDGDKAITMLKLMDVLDDLDDVQIITANFDIDEKVMESLAS